LANKGLAEKIGNGAKTSWHARQDGQFGEVLAGLSDGCRAVWQYLAGMTARSTNNSPTVSNCISVGVGELFVDRAVTSARLVALTKLPPYTVRRCLSELEKKFLIVPLGQRNKKSWTLAAAAFPEAVGDRQCDEAFLESHPEFAGKLAPRVEPSSPFAQGDLLFKTESLRERLQVAHALKTAAPTPGAAPTPVGIATSDIPV
jgi:hypothetical protein